MDDLSLGDVELASALDRLDGDELGAALLSAAAADRYSRAVGRECVLIEFQQSGATYLFDLASSAGFPQEDRTVAAWTLTPPAVSKRDASYQRGFPLPPRPGGGLVDRGHLVPRLSGGEFGPNTFRQNRALNRRWSNQGKRYRTLERQAADKPGTFFFGHLIYSDDSADPQSLEIAVRHRGALRVERFDNRPRDRTPESDDAQGI